MRPLFVVPLAVLGVAAFAPGLADAQVAANGQSGGPLRDSSPAWAAVASGDAGDTTSVLGEPVTLSARPDDLLGRVMMMAGTQATADADAVVAAEDGTVASSDDGLLGAPVLSPVAGEPAELSEDELVARFVSTMSGYSGALRAVVVSGENTWPFGSALPVRWIEMFPGGPSLLGEPAAAQARESRDAPAGAGVYLLERPLGESGAYEPLPIAVITMAPFDAKRNGRINGYHIGHYPTEGTGRVDEYAPPVGFIEVTPENMDFQISEHFRLGQFITKDQRNVWPKYVALDLRLIDKLELVLQELNAMGVNATAMHVMSGFRTPQYNGPGGNGRASLSRHMYGDAADVWVDSDGDGYMDDLNGDGRADLDDARVMLRAVERVEAKYPELIGGAGVYVATSAHGPFVHVDVRGRRARW